MDRDLFEGEWPTTEQLLAEIMADPPPEPGKPRRRRQNPHGRVKTLMREWSGRNPGPPNPYCPYRPWEQAKMAVFWVSENYFRGVEIPDFVGTMMKSFTPAQEREVIESLDRLGVEF